MTMLTDQNTLWGLPDPEQHAEFYSGVPLKRFLAWVVDSVLIFLISLIMIPLTAFTGLFFFFALWMAVGVIYRIGTLAHSSATPGMRLMAIEFRNSQGERFGTLLAVLHVLLFVAMWSFFIAQIVSMICILTTARSQGLHDMLLGTAAINRPSNI